MTGVMVFTIRGGRVVRFRHHYDPADITHASGRAASAAVAFTSFTPQGTA
jgi:hypothetical protein